MNLLRRRLLLRTGLLLPLGWLASCRKEMPAGEPQYLNQSPLAGPHVLRFGVHPLHNPQKLHQVFDPLMTYLIDKKHLILKYA